MIDKAIDSKKKPLPDSPPYARELYLKQVEKLEEYLEFLLIERKAIAAKDAEKLASYAELDSVLVKEILEITKCIDACKFENTDSQTCIPDLKKKADDLGREIRSTRKGNKELAEEKLEELSSEMKGVASKIGKRSVFNDIPASSMIDISG
jgi:hypothetical protein